MFPMAKHILFSQLEEKFPIESIQKLLAKIPR
jgi:hypothetical protein